MATTRVIEVMGANHHGVGECGQLRASAHAKAEHGCALVIACAARDLGGDAGGLGTRAGDCAGYCVEQTVARSVYYRRRHIGLRKGLGVIDDLLGYLVHRFLLRAGDDDSRFRYQGYSTLTPASL